MAPGKNNSMLNNDHQLQNSRYSPDRREIDRRGMDLSQVADQSVIKGRGPHERDNLEELNKKIDDNARDLITLFQRRKDLLEAKRRKLQDDYISKINLTRHQRLEEKRQEVTDINMVIGDATMDDIIQKNEFFLKVPTYVNLLVREINSKGEDSTRIGQRLQDFWNQNRNMENDIEAGLKKLNNLDDKLDSLNAEIMDNCKTLDDSEEKIRELLTHRTAEHISKAEPFFVQKKKIHENLEGKLIERNQLNDEKQGRIINIMTSLNTLKHLREDRINLLHELFDDKDNMNFSVRLYILGQIMDQLENMIAMKKNFNALCAEEEAINANINKCSNEIEALNSEFIEKHNEEARLYKALHENLFSRVQINKVIEYLAMQGNIPKTSEEDLRQLLTVFKEKEQFFKPFIEEDYKIIDGLKKTADTIQRLNSLNESIQNEKERRKDLYSNLEIIQNLKTEENNKSEALRKLDVEITKKNRQKSHIEEDLEYMKNEADLETYKKIGQVLNIHETSLNQLNNERQYLMREIEKLNKEIYTQISSVKDEYEDILKEIFPSDWNTRFDLKKLQDLSFLKITMTHTFKRLGIKKEEDDENSQ